MDPGGVNDQKKPDEEIELMDSSDSEADDEVVDEEEHGEEEEHHREPASPMAASVQQTAEIVPTTPFLKLLGYGTGIEVMRVRRPPVTESDRSPWAIKMMCPRREEAKEEAIEARLVKEAEFLRELSHPNIVGYRGHGEINPDKKYLAVEYCNSSLGDVLEKRFQEKLGPLEQPKAMKVVLDVLAGLNYLHTEALVMHGDVKSFNVLIKDDYAVVKLCDFGVSVKVTADGKIDLAANPDAQYVGTSLWSPPEVLEIGDEQQEITTKADMFAFGLLVFEMLVCTPPHTYAGLQDYAITTPSELISLHKKMVLTRCRLSMALSSEEPTLLDDGDEDSAEGEPKELKVAREREEDIGGEEACSPTKLKRAAALGDCDGLEGPKRLKLPTEGEQEQHTQVAPKDGQGNVPAAVEEKVAPARKEAPDQENIADAEPKAPQEVISVPAAAKDGEKPAVAAAEAAAPKDEPVLKVVDAEEGPIVSTVDDEDVVTISDTDSEASPPEIVHEVSSEDEDEYDDEEPADNDDYDDEYDEEEDAAGFDDGPYDEEGEYDDDYYDDDENGGYDGEYLNYGQVGTRPSIPAEVHLGPEYAGLLAIFHACTEQEPSARPSAARLLEAYRQQEKTVGGTADGTGDGGGGGEKKDHHPDPEPAAPVVLDAAANAEVVELLKKELAKK